MFIKTSKGASPGSTRPENICDYPGSDDKGEICV